MKERKNVVFEVAMVDSKVNVDTLDLPDMADVACDLGTSGAVDLIGIDSMMGATIGTSVEVVW